MIIPALVGLPESLRRSTAGRYTLARLFLFYGDRANALAAARSLAGEPSEDRWTRAADRLSRFITEDSGVGRDESAPD